MLTAINRLSCACLLLALTSNGAGAQQPQQRECFSVVMNNSTGGGSLGAILVDRCTGKTWILARIRIGTSTNTTVRWHPITVETTETVAER